MRSRAIKPGFWDNELLAECDSFARLLFIGLWNMADRAGRLEERIPRIKKSILGYDNVDAGDLLDQLAQRGFIVRYEVDGQRFIQVVNFTKHQNPHVKEPPSTIPEPCEHDTSTGLAPVEPGGLPLTDSLLLTPDSRLLTADSRSHAPTRAHETEPAATAGADPDVIREREEDRLRETYGSDWFEEAVRVAVLRNQPPDNLPYIFGILRNWKRTSDRTGTTRPWDDEADGSHRNGATGPPPPAPAAPVKGKWSSMVVSPLERKRQYEQQEAARVTRETAG